GALGGGTSEAASPRAGDGVHGEARDRGPRDAAARRAGAQRGDGGGGSPPGHRAYEARARGRGRRGGERGGRDHRSGDGAPAWLVPGGRRDDRGPGLARRDRDRPGRLRGSSEEEWVPVLGASRHRDPWQKLGEPPLQRDQGPALARRVTRAHDREPRLRGAKGVVMTELARQEEARAGSDRVPQQVRPAP